LAPQERGVRRPETSGQADTIRSGLETDKVVVMGGLDRLLTVAALSNRQLLEGVSKIKPMEF